MHRRISRPKKIVALSQSDTYRREQVLKSLRPDTPFDSDQLDRAEYATTIRLRTNSPRRTTQARLNQRIQDLREIKSHLNTHPDIMFLGFAGWGEYCRFKLPPNQGFSQTDSLVYRHRDGRVVIEKIGSCLEQFRSAQAHLTPLPKPKLQAVTSGGKIVTTLQKNTKSRTPSRPDNFSPLDSPIALACGTGYVPRVRRVTKAAHDCTDPNCTDRLLTAFWEHPSALTNPDLNDDVDGDNTMDPSKITVHTRLVPDTNGHSIGTGDEGCACCMNAIDLDELAGVAKLSSGVDDPYGTPAQLDSHWAVATGLGAPFACLGLVASYRNIKGAWATRSKLHTALTRLEQTPAANRTPQWHAARETLAYSMVDTHWNLIVPGGLNGISAAAVLTGLVVSSPVALPALALYGAAQTSRNIYDLSRTWRRFIHQEKIDQITRSKRRFYSANTLGFACVTTGAILTALSPATFGATLVPGLVLLGYGTVSTGLINNVWPKKFRPRNGDLGIDRSRITQQIAKEKIQTIANEKKAIKQFRSRYMPISNRTRFQLIAAKLLATLPGCDAVAQRKIHQIHTQQLVKRMGTIQLHQNELFQNIGQTDQRIEQLVTTHLKTLRYQQYGLVDFYWALEPKQSR